MPAPVISENLLLSLDKLHIYVCGMTHPIKKNGKIQKFQPQGRQKSTWPTGLN